MVYSKSINTDVFEDDSQCIREMDNRYDTWVGERNEECFAIIRTCIVSHKRGKLGKIAEIGWSGRPLTEH